MAKVILTSWQEIPSMVEVKAGRNKQKVLLAQSFQELIDLIAMKRGLDGSEEYLNHWRREPMPDREGDPAEVAQTVADELEAEFDRIRAEALANC